MRRSGKVPAGKREAPELKRRALKLICLLLAASLLPACVSISGGNLKVESNGTEIVSIGRDGFRLDGNMTGLTLDADGLKIEYPNGGLTWDSAGFNVTHADGSIRIADGKMVVTDKDGKQETLDTTGKGAEYSTDGGVLVRTGKKAELPADYPSDKVPLMDGFELNATANLGGVEVVSGYVPEKTAEDAKAFYQPILIKGDSYSQDSKNGGTVLRAKLNGLDVTIYLLDSLTAKAVDVSIVLGKK